MDDLFIWPVRVYYEDTDSGGVVYYANYLKFMERARTEWLRDCGLEQDELIRDADVLFAVRAAQIDYLRSARFNDGLLVSVRCRELRRASLSFEQCIHRVTDGYDMAEPGRRITEQEYARITNDDTPLCTAHIKVACLRASTLRPCPIPEFLKTEIFGVR